MLLVRWAVRRRACGAAAAGQAARARARWAAMAAAPWSTAVWLARRRPPDERASATARRAHVPHAASSRQAGSSGAQSGRRAKGQRTHHLAIVEEILPPNHSASAINKVRQQSSKWS